MIKRWRIREGLKNILNELFLNLNPSFRVKVYKADGIDLDGMSKIVGHEITCHAINSEYNAAVFITRETERPKWILKDDLINVQHYFFQFNNFNINNSLLTVKN